MTEKKELIAGRLPIGTWAKICNKYNVQGTRMQEQVEDLLLNKLLNDTFSQINVAQKTPSQSPETNPLMSPVNSHTSPQKLQSPITQDPIEYMRTFPPCPHNARQLETNMLVVFCSQNLEPPITDRKIAYFKVDPARCKLCIENFERQKSINETIAEQKRKQDRDYQGNVLTKRYMGDT